MPDEQEKRRDMSIQKNILILLVLLCVMTAEVRAADPLVLAGSGSNLAATQLLIDAFKKIRPEIPIAPLTNIGSTGAVQAAADGVISLGLLSRPLKDKEKAHNLVLFPYARTPFVVGAHAGVVDDGITLSDLVNIYKGTKTTWKNGRTIVVLTREPGESSIDLLQEKVPGFREVYADSIKARRWTMVMKDEQMNERLMTTPDAIGFSDMGTIVAKKLNIKPLKLNGIAPTSANVRNGTYTLFKPLAFTCRNDRLTPEVRAFIEYACSSAGHEILEKNGYAFF